MKTILDEIIENKNVEVAQLKKVYNYKDFEQAEYFQRNCLSIKNRLHKSSFGIIAEFKRKSPSAGIINLEQNIEAIGKSFEKSGAAAISCLTDTHFFGGSIEDLINLRNISPLPILRKEFIVDEFQIFQSKAFGADAILLIAEALQKEQALHFTILAQSLGLEVIMEFHSPDQLGKINDLVDIIGINNRDLKRQKTSLDTSKQLINFIPKDKFCISESGIRTPQELIELQSLGFKGALIGESILKESSPELFLSHLTQAV